MILTAADLYSFFVQNSAGHWAIRGRFELAGSREDLVVSPFVIAELEPLVRDGVGADGWELALEELASGAWTIAKVDTAHLVAMQGHVVAGATLAAASVAVLGEEGDS